MGAFHNQIEESLLRKVFAEIKSAGEIDRPKFIPFVLDEEKKYITKHRIYKFACIKRKGS